MALFIDYTILKQLCESRHPLVYDRVVFDPRAEAIMFERPSTLLLSKLTSVTNFLPSFVASWVAYFTGVAVYAMSMLAEVFRGAYFTDCLQTSVFAHTSAATLLTYAAYTPVFADATATTLFTRGALTPVLADASTTTLFTQGAYTIMLADASTTAVFTRGALTSVRALPCLTFGFGTHVAL